jgi:hypothetical protein
MSQHANAKVKHTFIDNHPDADDGHPNQSTSRLVQSAPNLTGPSDEDAPLSDLITSDGSPNGSALHGQYANDEPLCKPCAWLFKEGGCTNARNCKYCHLCPEGELKTRKKKKLAGIREAEREQKAQEEEISKAATITASEFVPAGVGSQPQYLLPPPDWYQPPVVPGAPWNTFAAPMDPGYHAAYAPPTYQGWRHRS